MTVVETNRKADRRVLYQVYLHFMVVQELEKLTDVFLDDKRKIKG